MLRCGCGFSLDRTGSDWIGWDRMGSDLGCLITLNVDVGKICESICTAEMFPVIHFDLVGRKTVVGNR